MKHYNRQDKLTSELCAEIDDLRETVLYWKERYEQLNREYFELSNNYHKSTVDTIGSVFSLTLRMKDTPEGILITNP